MCIAEAPGPEEDKQGRPFVGPAGETLNELLKVAGVDRDELYITNMVMCAPPEVRDPTDPEIDACWPRLLGQILAVDPDFIIAFGRFACKKLIGKGFTILQEHGIPRCTRIEGLQAAFDIAVMPMLHPSWIRKNYGIEPHGPVHRAVRELRLVRDSADFLRWLRTTHG